MKLMVLTCVFIKLLIFVNGAKILAVQIVPSKTFGIVMSSVLQTLALKHEITYYSITHTTLDHPNISLINIPLPEYINGKMGNIMENIFENMLKGADTSVNCENLIMTMIPEYVEQYSNSNIFQELLHLKPKYDVLIMFYPLSEYFIPFAYHLNVPLIQIATTSPYAWQNEAIGNPNFLSYDFNLVASELPDSFVNRLRIFMKHIRLLIRYNWYYLPSINEITMKYFPANTPSIKTISKNTSLLFVNTNEAMGYSRPTLSNYIEIGGLHCTPPKPLPTDLETFMQGAGEHGVIYFSFGATYKTKIPDRIFMAFVNVFKKLPQRIVWKVNGDMKDMPGNIKTLRWCPQQDILGHNKTKVFITQGGMLSLQETVYHGVPALVIPIIVDQPINAKIVQKLGYGRHLPLNRFSEDALFTELQELLTNPKYKNKAEEISSLMKDVQETPAAKLQWWVDYIIRHKGFPIYRPNDDRYSWTNYVDIDILLFIQFTILLVLVIIVVFSKLLFRKLKNHVVCIKNKIKTS